MSAPAGFGVGLACIVIAIFIWGAQLPVAKAAYVALDPYTLTAVRYAAALTLLSALLWVREGARAFVAWGPRPLLLGVAGTLGMAGSPILVFVGILYTQPEHAVIILALQPSMTALAQWLLHGRRPPGFTLGAIALAFCGVVLVVGSQAGATSGKLAGDLLVLAGAVSWIAYNLMQAPFAGLGTLRFTTLSCVAGTAVILVVTTFAHAVGAARVPAPSELVAVLPHVAFLAVLGVVAAMLLWNYGQSRVGPLNAILFLNLMPVVTYAIRLAQGARFTWAEWGGAALVVGALIANNLYQRRALR
jgi:drug/metabolite transporter (DMT)-like permease